MFRDCYRRLGGHLPSFSAVVAPAPEKTYQVELSYEIKRVKITYYISLLWYLHTCTVERGFNVVLESKHVRIFVIYWCDYKIFIDWFFCFDSDRDVVLIVLFMNIWLGIYLTVSQTNRSVQTAIRLLELAEAILGKNNRSALMNSGLL